MNTKKWKMKTGEKIRLKDMTDNHLANTIKLLEKYSHHCVGSSFDTACQAEATLNGEMAKLSMEQEIERLSRPDANVDFLPPIYWDMIEEIERRKIAVHKQRNK